MPTPKKPSSGTPVKRSPLYGARVTSLRQPPPARPYPPRQSPSSRGTYASRPQTGAARTRTSASRSAPPRSGKRKRKSTPTSRSFWIIIILLAVFALVYRINTGGEWENPFAQLAKEYSATIPAPAEGEIRVYFFDVGQGDSILLQTADNGILIDAGEYSVRSQLLKYLRDAGINTLDYVIATHPHDDHIGGMAPVLKNFEVKNVVMTDTVSTSSTYEDLLKTIEDKEIPVITPSAGDVIKAGLIELTVLAPLKDYSDDLNNSSVVTRMLYGDTAFLFTGDAEEASENDMLAAGSAVRANILKAGHHGSDTSTTEEFLKTVRPAAAVISSGKNNSYGHPNQGMLMRFAEFAQTFEEDTGQKAAVYRTDEDGTIIMSTNGTDIHLLS